MGLFDWFKGSKQEEVEEEFEEEVTNTDKEKSVEDKKKQLELEQFKFDAAKKDEEIKQAIKMREAEVAVLTRRAPLMQRLMELGEKAQEKRLELPHCTYVYKKNTDDKKKGDSCLDEPTHGKFCHTHHKMEMRRISEDAEKAAKKADKESKKKDTKRKKKDEPEEVEEADDAVTEVPAPKKTPKKRKVQKDKEEAKKAQQEKQKLLDEERLDEEETHSLAKRLSRMKAPTAVKDNIQEISDNDPDYDE